VDPDLVSERLLRPVTSGYARFLQLFAEPLRRVLVVILSLHCDTSMPQCGNLVCVYLGT
jgi:hypothetical protein